MRKMKETNNEEDVARRLGAEIVTVPKLFIRKVQYSSILNH
jgi:hypothetical protein